ETGSAAQLAPRPGGEPGGGRGERSVGGRGRGGGARARDRAAGGRADRRGRVVGGVDPTGRGIGPGAVSRYGAQPAPARALAAPFTALIAANLSGLLRPTPANVGVTQAALVVGLLPFGVAPEQAVAAGLALQGLQVLPVLLLGAMVTGWRLLKLETELA